MNKDLRVNEQILRTSRDFPVRVRDVRLIDDENVQHGVMTVRDALALARERGLDLIEVASTASPPVCRIMDYGKHKYEQAKKDRDAHKKQKGGDLKGVWMRPQTDDHDFQFKLKNAIKFLQDGDKVKITVRFRSREITHPEFAKKLMDKVVEAAQGIAIIEKPPAIEGRAMTMILAPSSK